MSISYYEKEFYTSFRCNIVLGVIANNLGKSLQDSSVGVDYPIVIDIDTTWRMPDK